MIYDLKYLKLALLVFWGSTILACNKAVQVPEPISSVTSTQVFSTDATATSAVLGIYSYMSGSEAQSSFSNSLTTINLGESADELTDGNYGYDFFLINKLTPQDASGTVLSSFWQPAYYDIYNANAAILGIQASTGMSNGAKNELTGEAKFIRAFCYFYLTNLFGDLPLVLDVDFNKTVLLPRSPSNEVYNQIIRDLLDAQNLLPVDFAFSGGQPVRANKWAATALLARAYLYQQNWVGADSAATAVINSGQFRLVGLDSVFLANSSEAILELQTANNFPYSTEEGETFIPYDSTSSATYWLTDQLLGAFEFNDLRRSQWVDSTDFYGTYYFYPYKYKSSTNTGAGSGPITENYILLRLAEQYLVRAEAEIEPGPQQNLNQAIADINIIRSRAGLPGLASNMSAAQLLVSLQHEKQIEFFAEWGHRWLDLKRWGTAIPTLGVISYKMGNIDSTQLLYPIPLIELQDDPNLTQNEGYQN